MWLFFIFMNCFHLLGGDPKCVTNFGFNGGDDGGLQRELH